MPERRRNQRSAVDRRLLMYETGSPIPWSVRAAVLIQLLDRGHGKPFQSIEVYDEIDVTIRFRSAEELRARLIEEGVPPEIVRLPVPQLIDATAGARSSAAASTSGDRRSAGSAASDQSS